MNQAEIEKYAKAVTEDARDNGALDGAGKNLQAEIDRMSPQEQLAFAKALRQVRSKALEEQMQAFREGKMTCNEYTKAEKTLPDFTIATNEKGIADLSFTLGRNSKEKAQDVFDTKEQRDRQARLDSGYNMYAKILEGEAAYPPGTEILGNSNIIPPNSILIEIREPGKGPVKKVI